MKPIDLDYNAREIIQSRIIKGLLGPGSDTWGLPDEEEIISDYPLQRYFTGILFPEKDVCKTQSEADDAEIATELAEADDSEIKNEAFTDLEADGQPLSIDKKPSVQGNLQEIEENKISQNNFFPTNIGLTIALDKAVREVDVVFSFGIYSQPKHDEIRIKIGEEGYKSFFDENLPYQLPFKGILKYSEGFMFLERPLKGYVGGKNQRSGEYKEFDKYREKENLIASPARDYVSYLEKLISRIWKRQNFNTPVKIQVKTTLVPQELVLDRPVYKGIKVGYNTKVIEDNNSNFIKIQLVNLSEKHPANRFSNKFENLNYKCLFQSKIKVKSEHIKEYRDYAVSTYVSDPELIDEEAQELDFIYRKVKSYCIGHNCSVTWSTDHQIVETTFIPQQDIKDVTTIFSVSTIENSLYIHNLSVWGLSKGNVISNLRQFVAKYKNWIDEQILGNNKLIGDPKKVGERLIKRQLENYERLRGSIELLNDETVFRAFQIANTAMLIQFIISSEKDFAKEEKELSSVPRNFDNKDLNYFRDYDAEKFKYYPFQLAFVLLSIDGIIHHNSRARKETVDLIWFPTGGGKTEAYLAVTAFTIAYRRIINQTGYEGTTVIMRYTLRLLTAQQFERASKLISALEFLRNQNEFKKELKTEPISIGLWVGQASTPNKIEDANKALREINDECEKRDRLGNLSGDPLSKNIFQMSSCPWCGTKLVSKGLSSSGKEIWKYGFKSKKNDFIINCINPECFFSTRLPIQVIDEVLYKYPPTLLFGTVDKFAMLAWQEEGYKFFNSHNDALPPELIIQDELHLLSGPLGSITGIYESVIELLCTKNGRCPKIIASTATTRNTRQQVSQLYGNREVNIFPPSGISYDDSYFAIESKEESKRRYIGFMPTGKTTIDTQLQILAHLLVARLEVYACKELSQSTDYYWSIVSYYNSLKDVGKIRNKVGDEVSNFTSTLQNRLSQLFQPFDSYKFNFNGILDRTEELTGRVDSSSIKAILKEMEKPFEESSIEFSQKGNTYLKDVIDLILATNMFSVGIDISRLNIMLLNGMPKNVAEYIQASSRIGRKTKGLALTLFDPNRAREKSYFEHYKSFHQAFYKSIAPLSVTPFTENTIDKMLSSILVTYVRNKVPDMAGNSQAQYFEKDMIEPLKVFIKERFKDSPRELSDFEKSIDHLADDWLEKIQKVEIKRYDQLLKKPSEKKDGSDDWVLMQSLREIDTNTYIQIKEVF